MKRVITIEIFLFLVINCFILNNAEAYMTFEAGLAQQVDNYNETNFGGIQFQFDKGINLALAIGGTIKKSVRLEGEMSYRKMHFQNRIDVSDGTTQSGSGDQNQLQIMFNGIWQIMPEWRFSPFIGAGIGVSYISWNGINRSIDDSDTALTYQLLAGASVRVTEKIFIEGTYYYVSPDDIELEDAAGLVGNLDNQQLNVFTLGVRINF